MEVSFANAYRAVRDSVTAGDPDGHIAVSGTQVTTAYDGCDWYRLDQVIDDFLSGFAALTPGYPLTAPPGLPAANQRRNGKAF